jgi:hypothetical protein
MPIRIARSGRTARSCVGVRQLLDSGAIPQPEYKAIKAKALASLAGVAGDVTRRG